MATWDEELVRYERPQSTSRLRDFLVMAAFSAAALAAAFGFVQFKYADRAEPASSEAAPQTAHATAPSQLRSAPRSEQPPASAVDVQTHALSEVRAELERTRGDLEAAIARVDRLEEAVQKLQVAPARDRSAEPETAAVPGAELPTHSDAAPTAEPASGEGNHASAEDAARVEGEETVPTEGKQDQHVTRPLPPPRKPALLGP